MKDGIELFKEEYPSLESYWRSINLFGRNVASYKFALAKSLLEIAPTGKTEITLAELAVPYSAALCEHLKHSPKQCTSQTSKFLDACRQYNEGLISHQALIDETVSKGFNNVIDAFHVVNGDNISESFYVKDYNSYSKKIILTDNMFKLGETANSENFLFETESRWNLVEKAWELGVSRSLLDVAYDQDKKMFFVNDEFRRKDVTSARGALNGYQKGKCFYCFDDIVASDDSDNTCDVDHFYPHTLQKECGCANLNGVWNLVLTCQECNRGAKGKFAKVPATKYITRLHKRNEFLISSHHPLRETIMSQTGKTEEERKIFIKNIDKTAINTLIHRWECEQKAPATF